MIQRTIHDGLSQAEDPTTPGRSVDGVPTRRSPGSPGSGMIRVGNLIGSVSERLIYPDSQGFI